MKILTISNQKGGVGKSTIAAHLACLAQEKSLRVLFIETDTQGNSSNFLRDIAQQEFDAVQLFGTDFPVLTGATGITLAAGTLDLADVEKSSLENFIQNFEKLHGMFDVVIIDTPPAMSVLQIAPMVVSNYLLAPFELSSFSVNGIQSIIQTITNLKEDLNPDLEFLGMLPSRVKSNDKAQAEILENLKSEYSHLLYRDGAYIPERQVIGMSASFNLPVWQMKDNSTHLEVSKIIKPIFESILDDVMGV